MLIDVLLYTGRELVLNGWLVLDPETAIYHHAEPADIPSGS
jgi:hypothetical protein